METVSFTDLYGRYAQSHIYMGFEIGVFLTIFQAISVQPNTSLMLTVAPARRGFVPPPSQSASGRSFPHALTLSVQRPARRRGSW